MLAGSGRRAARRGSPGARRRRRIVSEASLAPDIAWVARLGAVADPAQALPKPLYLRAPDAKPQDEARMPAAMRPWSAGLVSPRPPSLRIAPLDTGHAARLAAIHAARFARPWSALEFERLLAERDVLADGLFLGRLAARRASSSRARRRRGRDPDRRPRA